tara:strand:+ start:970 stop:1305 length:336 start_codon:yes stop_codon:yes gene_type:complete
MIAKLNEKITKLLKEKPETRDNDQLLQALIWIKEFRKKYPKGTDDQLVKFLTIYSKRKLSNPSSIKRCRAKIQELNKDLRGKTYDKRHQSTTAVKNELKSFTLFKGDKNDS